MAGAGALPPLRSSESDPMPGTPPSVEPPASAKEMEHLERAHHEIRTALTVLRSNVELVRVELRHDAEPSTHVAVQRHLTELDLAVDRLNRLAAQMRAWRGGEPFDPKPGSAPPPDARLLP